MVHMGVSKNRGTPKSSILIGFSIINHPFWDTIIFGNTHIHWFTFTFIPFPRLASELDISKDIPYRKCVNLFKLHDCLHKFFYT